MLERIVKVADWAAERGDAVLVTLGLGSCVAIMLHDPEACAGAMAACHGGDRRVTTRSANASNAMRFVQSGW